MDLSGDGRILQRRDERRIDFRDHILRRSGRRNDAEPAGCFEALKALFGECGDVGKTFISAG